MSTTKDDVKHAQDELVESTKKQQAMLYLSEMGINLDRLLHLKTGAYELQGMVIAQIRDYQHRLKRARKIYREQQILIGKLKEHTLFQVDDFLKDKPNFFHEWLLQRHKEAR